MQVPTNDCAKFSAQQHSIQGMYILRSAYIRSYSLSMLYCSRLVPDGKLFLGQKYALAVYLEFFDGGTDVIQSAVWLNKVISQRTNLVSS
jgi:hypothetical protein